MDWDATRPFEGDCEVKFFAFKDDEGREVFWHSSAHVLGETMELEYGVHLTHGPPTSDGFFYDAYTGNDKFTDAHYKDIEKAAIKIVNSKQKFERLVLTKDEALELFKENPFKVQTIKGKVNQGAKVTAYRCGDLIDLCTGPHIPNTNLIKAFKVMRNSAAYWLGNDENDSLQRVYAISFPTKDLLAEYIHFKEEAEKRDHRKVGRAQGIFDTHELSPGCAFFYPYGATLYNKLMNLMREQYRVRGFKEVLSPNIFNSKLWKISGHYTNYRDCMFWFKGDGDEIHGMKAMNCPAHCLMYNNELRSFRDLPMRFADFGVLHRNELSGALSGLTRVRRFQ